DTSMRLQNVVEENQGRLDQLTRDLAKFRDTLYRHFNLSLGAGSSAPPAFDQVVIEPPASAAAVNEYATNPVSSTTLPPASPPPAPSGPDPVELYSKAQRTFASSQDNPALIPQAIQEFDAFLSQYPN